MRPYREKRADVHPTPSHVTKLKKAPLRNEYTSLEGNKSKGGARFLSFKQLVVPYKLSPFKAIKKVRGAGHKQLEHTHQLVMRQLIHVF